MRNRYYVYEHFCPFSGLSMYIGHGAKARAWIHGSKNSVLRSEDHLSWLDYLNDEGFLPVDYVKILERNLTKSEACVIEQEYIRKKKPKFNKPLGKHFLKLDRLKLDQAFLLRESGLAYWEIAEELGVSTMTIYRALNNQTKNWRNNES